MVSYGLWDSPITAEFLAEAGLVIEPNFAFANDFIYFVERRPSSAVEILLSFNLRDSSQIVLNPDSMGVRSSVHEYGGVAFCLVKDSVAFVEAKSQGIHLCKGGEVQQIFAEDNTRFGDLQFCDKLNKLVAVAEIHGDFVKNELWFVGLDGRAEVAMSGADFYASPCFNGDGTKLCWLQWDLPDMAWDSARLWQGDIIDGKLQNAKVIKGGGSESCFQPEYDSSGNLFFICDNEFGFWQLHCLTADGMMRQFPLQDDSAWVECGLPLWQLGMRSYDFIDDDRIILSGTKKGEWFLYLLKISTGEWVKLQNDYCKFSGLKSYRGKVYFLGAKKSEPPSLVELDIHKNHYRILKSTAEKVLDRKYISCGEAMQFGEAFGFYYAPQNGDYVASDELPPLIMRCHGGPTAATDASFNGKIQFWTSRGFAVCDLNYRGSTGLGREFRESLYGQWGIYDTQDCLAAAKHLIAEGLADPKRMIISGSSAGGFSVLCALAFTDGFTAGCSAYGIGDLTALASDTHKFESRYLDRLIAPYPEEAATYKNRSPLFWADNITCPVLFLQGSEDKVVPPNQMFDMLQALQKNNIPCEHVLFDGEGHGFRKPENIITAYNTELNFYRKIFGLE